MTAGIQAADRLLVPAVTETLEKLELSPEDVAATRLALRYAEQLDKAAGMEAAAERVLRRAEKEDPELAELVSALKAKVSAQAQLAALGPRLVDVLDRLGAHPKARASLGRGVTPRGPGKLHQFRQASGA